ncbi:MAG: hypothetical protein HZA94_03190 [Candidatus Vogelbacteria bacterium]|nr:hypothetical protein [Candidatus Vogelbacteria bacterium]
MFFGLVFSVFGPVPVYAKTDGAFFPFADNLTNVGRGLLSGLGDLLSRLEAGNLAVTNAPPLVKDFVDAASVLAGDISIVDNTQGLYNSDKLVSDLLAIGQEKRKSLGKTAVGQKIDEATSNEIINILKARKSELLV